MTNPQRHFNEQTLLAHAENAGELIHELKKQVAELVELLKLCRQRLAHAGYCHGCGDMTRGDTNGAAYAREVEEIHGQIDAILPKNIEQESGNNP